MISVSDQESQLATSAPTSVAASSMNEELEAQILRYELQLARLENQEKCQTDFLSFVRHCWPEFIPGRHHRIMAEKFEQVAQGKLKRLIICLAPRHCLALDTPILTMDELGRAVWKTMKTVKQGDFVFGPDGQPTRVVGKSPVYQDRDLYRVTTNDGASVITDAQHRWMVRLSRRYGKFIEYTTEQLWARDQGALVRRKNNGETQVSWGDNGGVKNPRAAMLPEIQAVDLPDKDLLVDPYVLGLWLGDGTKNNAVITCHDTDAAIIRPEIERRGYKTTDQSTPMTFGVLDLKVKLRELGVLGNKHIPAEYMTASIRQRKDLIRGLMDADGNVSKAGQSFFLQKSLALITQVREVLWSLGVRNTLQTSEAKIEDVSYGDTYRLSFYEKDLCFLPRKRDRAKGTIRGRFIRVEKLEQTGAVQCIEVEREDHLFLAGKGMICTMNTKSEFGSFLLPSWMMGRKPNMQIIQATHTAELAIGFGRRVKNLIDSDTYRDIFPGFSLAADSKAKGRWDTDKGGRYYALGVGGAMAGRGGDLVVIDDPHSEADAMSSTSLQHAYHWYQTGPRQRLQPNGAIIIIMTRWGENDLVGNLLRAAAKNPRADQWDVVEFPAILPSGKPCWPEFWTLKELMSTKESINPFRWAAQYQQNPTSVETSILKREWWRIWDKKDKDGMPVIPPLEHVIQTYDTAYSAAESADFSAISTWGIFRPTEDAGPNIMLMDARKGRWEFPELKRIAKEQYDYWEPDDVLIEGRASGLSLAQELRFAGIPVNTFAPSRGKRGISNDRMARANSVAPVLESGVVWAPGDSSGLEPFAEELVHECAAFPNGQNDDYVDVFIMAMQRFRRGNFVRLPTDFEEEEPEKLPRKYY